MGALPVTVLTGFLGAGKTTLLRRLLAAPHGRRIGVILNELGQAGIDDVDVAGAARRATIELGNGCVCCIRSPDLIAALGDMQARGDVDLVIVETTGVADPLALTWTLARPDLAEVARLDAVVTVVDAVHWRATREAPEWEAQVRCADLVVVAKLDAAAEGALTELRTALAELGATDRVIDGRADLPIDAILDLVPDPHAVSTRADAAGGQAPAPRHSGYQAVSLRWPAPARFRADAVEDVVEALPPEVFRAKGLLYTDGGRWASFQAVGGRIDFDPDVPAPSHGESRVVLLGPGLHQVSGPPLADLFARCLAMPS